MQRYTSKTNLAHIKCFSMDTACESACSKQPESSQVRKSRASVPEFDWGNCVICLKKSHKKDHRLSQILTKDREFKLKEAAECKSDEDMLLRILHEDLIARDAVYHSACFSTYVRKSGTNTVDIESYHSTAFTKLITDIDYELHCNNKGFSLSTLLEMYRSYLPDNLTETYTTQKLQARLLKYYGESIVVQKQYGQGMSSIIMSSNISMSDAIRTVTDQKSKLHVNQLKTDLLESPPSEDPDSILYLAATILRNDMASYITTTDYPSPKQISLSSSQNIMPSLTTKFIEWLVDKSAFDASGDDYQVSDDKKRKCIALTECLVANSLKVETPLQIGLAIQLHHEYGSRNLIDTLNSHGFYINYDDLTKFITSVATSELEHIQAETYIPSGIIPVSSGGFLVQEGDDNVDINAETIDGKNTFHSMARVVFQEQKPGATDHALGSIKRGQNKSLPMSEDIDSLMKCLPFEKPKQRAEPPCKDHAKTQIVTCQNTLHPHSSDVSWVILRSLPHNVIPQHCRYK